MHFLVSIVTRSKSFNKGHEVYELVDSTNSHAKKFLKHKTFPVGDETELCDCETELDIQLLTFNFDMYFYNAKACILTGAYHLPKG